MIPVLIILGVVLFITVTIILIEWSVHWEMTKEKCGNYGFGSYKDFKREFVKYNWETLTFFPDSYEDREHDCYYHADIVKINGIGMLLRTPIDWYLIKRFVKQNMQRGYYNWSANKM